MVIEANTFGPITPEMLKPMTLHGDDGYAPLDAVVCWVATKGGSVTVELTDEPSWQQATSILMAKAATGKIEIVGRPFGTGSSERIDRLAFVGIKVINPLHETDISSELLSSDPHIVCSFFGSDWEQAGGDKYYQQYVASPAWTHIRVSKADLNREFSFPRVENTNPLPKPIAPGKPGRKPAYDWYEVKLFVQQELDRRGDFDDPDQMVDWKSQADLERSVADYFSKQGTTPAVSLIRKKIRPMIDEWRLRKNAT